MPHVDVDWSNYRRRYDLQPELHEIVFLIEAKHHDAMNFHNAQRDLLTTRK